MKKPVAKRTHRKIKEISEKEQEEVRFAHDVFTESFKRDDVKLRIFDSGATRDVETDKLDFEGFLSPAALECFAIYMNFHRQMPDGSRRDSDNWQKGFPGIVLVKSMWRHFFSFWRWARFANYGTANASLARSLEHPLIDLCGVMFNVQAYMRQMIEEDPNSVNEMLRIMTLEREQRLRKQAP